jgi:hypothetical protein
MPRLYSEIETPVHPRVHRHAELYWTSSQLCTSVTISYYCECGKMLCQWTE